MEKGEQLPAKDPYLVSLRETGQCRIPFRGKGQENEAFVDLIDQVGEYSNQLANQLGVKIISNGCWEEDLGHHLFVRIIE